MRRLPILLAAGVLVLAACSDRQLTQPERPAAPSLRSGGGSDPAVAPAGCPTADQIETMIRQLFPAGQDRRAALSRWEQIESEVDDGSLESAKHHALQLADFALRKYFDGRLIGGQSTATAQALSDLLTGIFCWVGLPPFNPAALGLDGAAVVIDPTSPPTDVVTGTGWAGVHVNTGDVPTTTLITIRRLPDFPGPLLTPFDQYPIFYEFEYNPGITFVTPVVVGTCLATSATPPDLSRLRLAHNVAPYTWGSIEVAPLATPSFLDCTDADVGAVPTTWGIDGLARGSSRLLGRALAALFVPRPLYAASYFGSGVGGTVRNFSPFGIVDTLGIMTPATRTSGGATWAGDTMDDPAAVYLNTPTGQPMFGVPVTFTVTQGGGSVEFPATTSDLLGFASSGLWRLGPVPGTNAVSAAATGPAGTGFSGSPTLFTATGLQH